MTRSRKDIENDLADHGVIVSNFFGIHLVEIGESSAKAVLGNSNNERMALGLAALRCSLITSLLWELREVNDGEVEPILTVQPTGNNEVENPGYECFIIS